MVGPVRHKLSQEILKSPEVEANPIVEQLLRIAALTQSYRLDQRLEDRLKQAVELVARTFGVDGCVLRTLEGDELVLRAAAGMEGSTLPIRLSASFGISTALISSRKALAIEDIMTNPLTARYARENLSPRFLSYAGAPMLVEGEVTGMLGIYAFKEQRAFSELDLGHLQIVANHLAVVLQTEELMIALKAANEELDRRVATRTAALLTAHEEMREVTSAIAHDLRSPLRAIVGFGDLILNHDGGVSDDVKPFLQRQRKAAERMSVMLDDLLGLARLGNTRLHVERLDAARIMEELWRERGPLDGKLLSDVSIPVFGDHRLVTRLIQNLLDNSIKFRNPKVPLELRLNAFPSARPGFLLRDNGIGFSSSDAANIFRPFERLANHDQTVGTGIGLATVRRIIEMHGGNIVACGEPEVGATFRVTLSTPRDS